MVRVENQGLDRTFEFTRDRFAADDDRLRNFTQYHFMVVSYAVAEQNVDDRYLQGRLNVRSYTAVPHNPKHRFGGAIVNADYDDQPPITRISGLGNSGFSIDLADDTRDQILSQGEVSEVSYQINRGPLDIKVYNPLIVPDHRFELRVEGPTHTGGILDSNSVWVLENLDTEETYTSDHPIIEDDQQIFTDYGFSVRVDVLNHPGLIPTDYTDNGLIEVTREYDDRDNQWLTGVPRFDGLSPFNWLRAGQSPANPGDYANAIVESALDRHTGRYMDPNGVYTELLDEGVIGPYPMASGGVMEDDGVDVFNTHGPFYPHGPTGTRFREHTTMRILSSVDLVLTSDRSKWSRSVVIETGSSPGTTQGNRNKFELRAHPSLELDGSYNNNEEGRGYFPGYAIDVETGQRLNIIYGEASNMPGENGRDMIWNPTTTLINQSVSSNDPDYYRFGGKHYTYIMSANHPLGTSTGRNFRLTTYDGGEMYHEHLSTGGSPIDVFNTAMWVMLPLVEEGHELLSYEDGLIPSDVKIRLRVNQPFAEDSRSDAPVYRFSTEELAIRKEDRDVAVDALDDVGIVPNPYYASSPYETTQLDNRAKIINLPRNATVNIYSQDGNLVRSFDRNQTDDAHQTYLDWNLRNQDNIPISSGMYIIHVEGYAENADGEEVYAHKTLKWFAIMRPFDLDTF